MENWDQSREKNIFWTARTQESTSNVDCLKENPGPHITGEAEWGPFDFIAADASGRVIPPEATSPWSNRHAGSCGGSLVGFASSIMGMTWKTPSEREREKR